MINTGYTQIPHWKFIFHLGMSEFQSLDCKGFRLGNALFPTVSHLANWDYC